MIRNHTIVTFIVLVAVLAIGSSASAAAELPVLRIGIITDGPVVRETSFVDLFIREIEGVTAGTYRVEFPDGAVVDGGWDPETHRRRHGRAARPRRYRCHPGRRRRRLGRYLPARRSIDTPVVVPFAFGDCAVSCSRLPNVSTRPIDLGKLISRDLEAFHDLIPFDRLAVLMDSSVAVQLHRDRAGRALAPAVGRCRIRARCRPVASDVAELLPPDTDAVYIMPLFQLDEADSQHSPDSSDRQGPPDLQPARRGRGGSRRPRPG